MTSPKRQLVPIRGHNFFLFAYGTNRGLRIFPKIKILYEDLENVLGYYNLVGSAHRMGAGLTVSITRMMLEASHLLASSCKLQTCRLGVQFGIAAYYLVPVRDQVALI